MVLVLIIFIFGLKTIDSVIRAAVKHSVNKIFHLQTELYQTNPEVLLGSTPKYLSLYLFVVCFCSLFWA